MSDLGRKDFSSKVSEAVEPDSNKGGFQKAKEGVTDKMDNLAGSGQPNQDKGFMQQVSDTISGNKK
ncbi:hypothetical protein CANARDRAFT_202986 [[Candida] arabinofermentans NRRL YB-2248]|uniref:Heat shock protein 9/12 n=1 Tax=[Candida] arabinofermentans NRRL YB-2248 TaxID=983967 RepID=A0A1E4SVK6_9ASCO|nr:hypothetical protein CANARDRAFT_202986 [[Candida] arabinofermentans NRRL YB-2248]